MSAILPGSCIGIIGGGQLGRMLTLAAKQMGYRVKIVTDQLGSPGAQIADDCLLSDMSDTSQLASFFSDVDVFTYETENLPLEFVEAAAQWAPVRPGASWPID